MRAVKLIFTNESRGYTIGDEIVTLDDSTLWGGDGATLADVYREAVREHFGRCTSKVYRDIATARCPTGRRRGRTRLQAEHVGYFFVSRQRYEDSDETYKRGVWVIVGEHQPAVREDVT